MEMKAFIQEAFLFCGASFCFMGILAVAYVFKSAVDVAKAQKLREVGMGLYDRKREEIKEDVDDEHTG